MFNFYFSYYRSTCRCNLSYNFLLVDLEDELPAMVNFQRTSARVGKQLITMLKATGFRRTIVLRTEPKTNNYGKFFVYAMKLGRELSAEEQALLDGYLSDQDSGRNS